MDSKEIYRKILSKYADNCIYKICNAFIYRYNWESDVWIQRKSKHAIEFEVKNSYADFVKDFNKIDKHEILSTGKLKGKEIQFRPNRFYYVCPENIIPVDKVPEYAGLIYVKEGYDPIIIKEARLLHREKLEYEKKLCKKYYFRYYNLLRLEKIKDYDINN